MVTHWAVVFLKKIISDTAALQLRIASKRLINSSLKISTKISKTSHALQHPYDEYALSTWIKKVRKSIHRQIDALNTASIFMNCKSVQTLTTLHNKLDVKVSFDTFSVKQFMGQSKVENLQI